MGLTTSYATSPLLGCLLTVSEEGRSWCQYVIMSLLDHGSILMLRASLLIEGQVQCSTGCNYGISVHEECQLCMTVGH